MTVSIMERNIYRDIEVEAREKIADTAVIIGKFYPPHLGHKLLIETAASQSKHVSVVVGDSDRYKIPGELRALWLQEIHPNVDVLLREEKVSDNDMQAWADETIKWLGYHPQIVYTSEDYGKVYAEVLGSSYVMVDKMREKVPISGTKIRSNPLEYLDFLEPNVRAYFVKRICVLGAESTGTTTMARALAEEYDTVWVPEFGRRYSEIKIEEQDNTWKTEEFSMIADRQMQQEEEMARVANKLLVCDTNAFVTSIWHERYMGSKSHAVEDIGTNSKCDLYLLTDVNIPFVQDGTRDGEHVREWMHQRFIDELENRNLPYVILSGNHDERLEKAKEAVDFVMSNNVRVE